MPPEIGPRGTSRMDLGPSARAKDNVPGPCAPREVRASFPSSPPREGESFEDILRDFEERVVPGLTHWNHPGFMAYFANTASSPAILAELLAAAVNANAMLWRTSPAATEVEGLTTDWLRQLLGLPEGFAGFVNDTASHNSLYALAAARAIAFPEAGEQGLHALPAGRVYASEHVHSSIDKAVVTLGLGAGGCATWRPTTVSG